MGKISLFVLFRGRSASVVAGLVLVFAMAGCGGAQKPGLVPVQGTVTQGGSPLSGAEVMFMPKNQGVPAAGKTDDGGRFELRFSDGRRGALPGSYGVLITKRAPEPPPPMGGPPPPPQRIQSPIEFRQDAEVKPSGVNNFNMEVPK